MLKLPSLNPRKAILLPSPEPGPLGFGVATIDGAKAAMLEWSPIRDADSSMNLRVMIALGSVSFNAPRTGVTAVTRLAGAVTMTAPTSGSSAVAAAVAATASAAVARSAKANAPGNA